ncbi:hypothetical protein BV22DRAFT_1129044 [Leucogyrophana mollusca]|uniref:Uncharacterized protein n=1 Tax=Leucogyrophana mollusca TaxID=85980 RepID=A0ACB8BKL8_9AGAM|nr:hypothetical protein BV22DRAFT_1129044 [Leucogyrophana mollusca]
MSSPKRKQWKKAELKPGDTVLKDAQPTDIVILVMGPHGVGKSTFINTTAGRTLTKVGHSTESCTATIQHAIFPYPYDTDRRVVLVDTPGLDDAYADEVEVLRRIAVWLAYSYNANLKLSGVIYLHDISQASVMGRARHNFAVFNKLCGAEAAEHVTLATTKWANVKSETGQRHEQQLRDTWKDWLCQGSEMAKFTDTRQSAWDIIDSVTKKQPLDALRIQREMVDLGKRISETAAGNTLRTLLEEQVVMQKRRFIALQISKEGGDNRQANLKETEDQIYMLLGQIQTLKTRRKGILGFFGCSRK